ncbi:uncharacterized protein LOC110446353 [Mizuhopecten yessoensis]|uniref:Uncharacterized protein n=1 Tax=Mizuhopecten yessoensis TaxID=6573 RepID=A0A210QXM3_MIZYE|nr:uncharacterized protein LOC110446353 [Mizuhopecten yessoensis]OWF53463.1 hypothetical protein KP79_PYT22930 [Mizuhopecten yessoensis]
MANLVTLPALVLFVLCVGVGYVAAIAQKKVAEIAPLDSTKTSLNNELAATKPEVASFTMMDRMMKSLKEKNKDAPNKLSDFSPLLAKIIQGLSDRSKHGHDASLMSNSLAKHDGKASSMTSTHTDHGHYTSISASRKQDNPEGRLTAQSSIADIMAHLNSGPSKDSSPSSSGQSERAQTFTGSDGHQPTSGTSTSHIATPTFDYPLHTTSGSEATAVALPNGMKSIGIQLKVALDLLETSATTLTSASNIIRKVVTDTSMLEHLKGAATSGTLTGNGHEPSGTTHGDKSVSERNGGPTSGNKHKEEKINEWHPSGSRREGSIVDNRHLSPWQSGFGETVPVERGSIHSPVRQGPVSEKDFVKSGTSSLQPNTKDQDKFKHPLDYPFQAEPYPNIPGNDGKSPNMMSPHPGIDMHSFQGSMMTQFESPVPMQHSMPMAMPNQGFPSGPNQPNFGSGPGPALNRGFMPPGNPRSFMQG